MKIIASAAALAFTAMLVGAPASACNGNGNCSNAPGQLRGAPGPIAGAGLPVLAVGYGVYWLVKRRRKAQSVPRRANTPLK
jgi:hypothetical protein